MDPPPPPPVDLLSTFPEHLQDEILTRLDLRDAVRTSALSRAWRRRWETLPGLALSFPDGTAPSVIDRVLLRYAGPRVSRFACYLYADEDDEDVASHVDDWLIALSRRGVESMAIFNERGPRFAVHSSIFSCNRLVSLSLKRCCIPPLPHPGAGGGFAGFPVLEEVYLSFVKCTGRANGESQLHAILRASPMLRVLVLDCIKDNDMDYVIEAPNLHTLRLSCAPTKLVAPNLQCACINVPEQLQAM